MKLRLLSSMVLDAVCACSLIDHGGQHMHVLQNEVLDILKERTGDTFQEGAPSYSNMCSIVVGYLPDPSSASLDDLYDMFASISEVDQVIHAKITNEFKQSYIFPTLDMLKNGGAEKYCEYIAVLKEADFEGLWREKILPAEQAQIEKLRASFGSVNIDSLLQRISQLKGIPCNEVTTYVSLMSYPVSFTLNETSFLDTINDSEGYYQCGFLSMIAHELMHGFASSELIGLYQDFMARSRYLRATHHALIRDMHSGDEEEFVMAAEYYILWSCHLMTKEQIILKQYPRYGGCVPLALYIFDFMTHEACDIKNYNQWLLDCFHKGAFSEERVFSTFDSFLPEPTDYDCFFANLFVRLYRCYYILRDAQLTFSGDIQEQIEALTGRCFIPNAQTAVSFANGEIDLTGRNVERRTLRNGNLTIEKIEFVSKKEALDLRFPYRGANIGVAPLVYEGETFARAYILNLAFHKTKSNRAEFSFVCGNVRYLVTSACRDGVIDIDTEEDPNATYRAYGKEMIEAVKQAEQIVMLMQ